ncbi:TIGR01212 family radical SAM protein [Acholeplasma laidlawii]|jgi:radical SAM protein (TIGR01212 family)|uniref:Fe-S oxidoreductase, radical SAM superfamily n=3 Tax=Acholeplasma laidlawii TaxID=2148 RepID=A9NEU1_ACHLI|nr:TIGR01212 family radical SAM protein [Acholeplasma laidlawii]ABX80871.1 Fe-S oxidoreductase, radical SAM superfamily [Acholeplasma laidlawii PG-8A]NWH10569.1 TIGR01212 family radical SAM protein [Acholeplasma laidlawii]NWH11954.1 TIGR01212 family radical SAM protein [Acholeplasma laidlawii]NWH12637.1 TIGR01212 family radical SAM protein [Acholeplasma laidlawii]NWH13983.1 TIGR01212 family radical SAM protein [Acholeplasma laidlawii]
MNLLTKEKHYNTLNNYYRKTYNQKVFKVALNAGFTCPNIDGTVASGGCTFCSWMGSGDFAGDKRDSLKVQFENIKQQMHKKWKDGLYIAYFQANTNTHAPLPRLKEIYEEAITLDPKIVMISLGTRPDSLPEDVLDYLEELNTRMPVQVELGLQTIHQSTSDLINRAHDLKTFDDAVLRLHKRGIEVVVHIINGLPTEDKKMMLDTVKHLNTLPIQGIKIHMLHLMEKTKMGYDYIQNPWELLTLEEYVDITTDQLLWLRPDIIVHRVTGDAPEEMLIAPLWTKKKFVVSNEIDKRLRKLGLFQGAYYEESKRN